MIGTDTPETNAVLVVDTMWMMDTVTYEEREEEEEEEKEEEKGREEGGEEAGAVAEKGEGGDATLEVHRLPTERGVQEEIDIEILALRIRMKERRV